jgi:hypothetical protein
MPGPADTPAQTSVVLERPADNGPFGAKGIGEMTANAPIPAIANAIFDAVGVRIDRLPFSPARVLAALRKKQADEQAATVGSSLGGFAPRRGAAPPNPPAAE